MKIAGSNTQFHRVNGENSRMWFSVEKDDFYNEILIGLIEDATDDEDRLYDAVKMKGNPDISLSAVDNETEYAIMAFPPPTFDKTVPLQLEISEAGPYQFTPNTMENFDGYDVYLEDTRYDRRTILEQGVPITVNVGVGIHTDRFFLNFVRTTSTGVQENRSSPLSVYSSNEGLYITGLDIHKNANIELMDMSGRLILSEYLPLLPSNSRISLPNINSGVYIVRLTTETETLSTKILIPQ